MRMGNISIEPVLLDELSVLAQIGEKTFRQTFASSNEPKNFEAYLDKAFSQKQLLLEIENPEASFTFAKVDGKVVGYLKTNRARAQSDKVEGKTLEIERIYVDADAQGLGLGKALFEHALEEAKAIGADAVWLGVWEDNPNAIEFYARQGFREFGEHEFRIGKEVQRDIMMRLEL